VRLREAEKMMLHIRPALTSDAEYVEHFAREFEQYLREHGDVGDNRFGSDAFLRDGFGAAPAFNSLIAELDGHPIGSAFWHWGYDIDNARRNIYLVDLFVTSGARGMGVGRAMMNHLMNICRQSGGIGMFWSVYDQNDEAIAFYKQLGARSVSRPSTASTFVWPMGALNNELSASLWRRSATRPSRRK
jgi:GNAT superfamily N-acetyltransferase